MSQPAASQARALVIGLDVGDGEMIRAWCEEGALPNLRALIEEGSFGKLASPAETLHISAWPSVYTGTSPGNHGVYYTFQPAPGEQGAVRFRSDQYGCATLWEVLAAAGKRCVVLDAPYTHPVPGCSATQVFEWGTWAHYGEARSVPAGRLAELQRACGDYPLGLEANRIGLAALDPAELAPRLVEAAKAKGRAARWLMEAEPWDFFLTVFGETHPATHYLWPEGRVSGLADSPQGFRAMREVYRAIDEAIGSILEAASPDDCVFVVSGDGAVPNHGAWHLLPEVLKRLGHIVPPAGGGAEQGGARGGGSKSLYGKLRGLVPEGLRQSVSRRLPARFRDALMKRKLASEVDWTRTRAFCLPTDLEGCIRVNLRGREPEGIVEPGADYERLCEELCAALGELVEPETGDPAVRRVVRVDEAMPGPQRDLLPDLVVQWWQDRPIERLSSPEIGTLEAPSPDRRLGTHGAVGFVIARGAPFPARSRIEEAHCADLAPTVLRRFDLSAPAHMQGTPLEDRIAR